VLTIGRRVTQSFSVLPVLAVLSLAATGCGGGDGTTPATTAAPPASTEAQNGPAPDPVIGKWRGTGTEIETTGKARSYTVTLDIAALDPQSSAGRVDYPSFPCGGTLRYLGAAAGGGQAFRELIHYGKAKCSRGGRITVKPDGQALDWTWEGEAGLVVKATLRRV
jgi:hypothetical protein